MANFNWKKINNIATQSVVAGIIAILLYSVFTTTKNNLIKIGVNPGFDFLSHASGFDISIKYIYHDPTSSNFRVMLVGLTNTVIISFFGCITATIVGVFIALANLSSNWIVKKLGIFYIEVIRNIPLAVQLTFWYIFGLVVLPYFRDSLSFANFFLNNRGLFSPKPIFTDSNFLIFAIGLFTSLLATLAIKKYAKQKQIQTGLQTNTFIYAIIFFAGIFLLCYLIASKPIVPWSLPKITRFKIIGGMVLQIEVIAMFIGLVAYTGAFSAEVIRAGLLSVPKGQHEAAASLGLSYRQRYTEIIFPQAMPVIIPNLTSQFLNLTKNSSLCIVIGFPDLVAVFAVFVLKQTGQAIEILFITMLVYLSLSLSISLFMNIYNRKHMIWNPTGYDKVN